MSLRAGILLVVVAVSFCHAFVASHTALNVRIGAHRDECFFEDVRAANTKVFFHFSVTNGGALDIDASVFGPDGQLIWSVDKEIESRILFKAKIPGPHKFCFSNKMSTVTVKTVTFAIQVGDAVQADGNTKADPLQQPLTEISEGLTEIKNDQAYLRTRERIHREVAESTNSRVLLWSLVEISLIGGFAAAQIWYLVSRFEKRRNV